MPDGPTICLNMIVRDEAHVVTEGLETVAPLIDRWVIVDTGSTDGTPEVIRSWFAERGIPGELHQRPWRDFGTNRSEALALCRDRADYAWVFDADDRLVGTPDFTGLTAGAYELRLGDDFTYWRTALFRTDLPWRFVGVVHEFAACDEPATVERLDGDYFVDSRRSGGRSAAPDKYERDARLLEAVVAADPADARATFYLAQSWMDAGEPERAAGWYARRAEMPGWDEETFVARLRRAQCLERMGRPWEELVPAYLDAWESRPSRVEPLHELARRARDEGRFELGYLFARQADDIPFPEDDRLFVAADAYRWRVADERSICAFYVGRHRESFELCAGLLDSPHLPETERDRVTGNRDFAVPALLEATAAYPADVVQRIVERGGRGSGDGDVTLTITTCRRPDLFDRTMSSFLACCEDLDRIDRLLCVDDGSSPEDLARMTERYPFLELVAKDPAERGHAGSMNRLLDEVTTPYWLHLEDDWHFFAPDRYVTKALSILDADPDLGQVLFNRAYGETLEDRTLAAGPVRWTDDGVRYRRHEHIPGDTPEHTAHVESLPPGGRSNAWWPHFSLRPSMLRTAAVRRTGRFDPAAGQFERDFARRWTAVGWRSGYLDVITCLHTGPLTSDTGAERRPNAYDLNHQPQFGGVAPSGPVRVRLVGNWTTSEELVERFAQQAGGGTHWGDIELTAGRDADYTVVLNHPGGETVDPSRTVVVPMEPSASTGGWGEWADPDPSRFLQVRSRDRYANVPDWHLGLGLDELRAGPVEKTRLLSTVTSGRAVDPGHRLRLTFLRHLDEHGVEIDVYGRDPLDLAGYRGPLPPCDKREGLLPYRYTFAAENHAEPNYLTEKLVDSVLAECLCFYWGCPNLEDLVDPETFIRLPLEDPEASRRIVEEAIRGDEWARRIGAIRAEKRRIIDDRSFPPTLARVVDGHRTVQRLSVRVVNLERRPDRWRSFAPAMADAAGAAFADRCERFAAVDGRELTMTDDLRRLFRDNTFGDRRGILGCALSHLELWREAAASERPATLVLEDDVRVRRGFAGELIELCGRLGRGHPAFDLVLLGWQRFDPDREPQLQDAHLPLRPLEVDWENYLGGCSAYLVSRAGATKLVAATERDGIQVGIDWFMRDHADELDVLGCAPHLAWAPLALPSTAGDSDIQHDFEPVR